jgi:hypothetical protein
MARTLEGEAREGAAQDAAQPGSGGDALRAEHDALARRLSARPSAEALRRAAVAGFFGLVSFGVSWGLLWDRQGKAPTPHARAHADLYRFGALFGFAVAAVLVVLCAVTIARWRRLAREEERLFARLGELRRALGIDP